MTDNFVVIHGINSEDLAQGITSILKDYKEYKVVETPIIISAENYTIVQIKKNIDDYLAGNLEDNPPPPNWDGTIDKTTVVQQPKQDEPNPEQQQNNPENNPTEGKIPTQAKEKEFDMPPSPQVEKSYKKG